MKEISSNKSESVKRGEQSWKSVICTTREERTWERIVLDIDFLKR